MLVNTIQESLEPIHQQYQRILLHAYAYQTMMDDQAMKIIATNVNSIFSNQCRDVLLVFFFVIQHDPYSLLLSENKLQPKCRLSFNNLNFVRKDRAPITARPNGGTGFLLINSHCKLIATLTYTINQTVVGGQWNAQHTSFPTQ